MLLIFALLRASTLNFANLYTTIFCKILSSGYEVISGLYSRPEMTMN